MDMLKRVIKSVLGSFKIRKETKEIRSRIANNNLLKDCDKSELDSWKERIRQVKECGDTGKINVREDAGTLVGNYLLMHNGLRILPLSYYGYPMLKMLMENKGIHEPQEEYAFQEVLKSIPKGAVMIELGAYWSFYSMWFNKEITDAKNYMIEPWEIEHGIRNFKLNKLKGEFFQYYISEDPGIHTDGSKIISVDSFIKEKRIDFVDILHSDIQGNELKMLKGASNLIDAYKVGYIFISTHSDDLHENCAKFLIEKGYQLVCSAVMKQTCSYDGLLVFKNPHYNGVEKIQISHRKS